MFYETYGGSDDAPHGDQNVMSSVIAKAEQRAKRKRQEETFQARRDTQEEAKKRKNKVKNRKKVHEVRDETLEQRNARKLAAKQNRKKANKDNNSKGKEAVVSQELLIEALTMKKSTGVEDEGENSSDSDEGEEDNNHNRGEDTSTSPSPSKESTEKKKEIKMDIEESAANINEWKNNKKTSKAKKQTKMEEDRHDHEHKEEPVSTATTPGTATTTSKGVTEEKEGEEEVPKFYDELNFAHKKNMDVQTAQKFEDEDDERIGDMAINMKSETSSLSLTEAVLEWGLHDTIRANLEAMKVDQFFPVQRTVVPSIIRDNSAPFLLPRDMCISAPTGSGKTLAYVVPIVQTLLAREVIRLAALILLPSRELAIQVFKVVEAVTKDTGIRAGIITGQRPFHAEQVELVGKNVAHPYNPLTKVTRGTFQPCYRDSEKATASALAAVHPGPSGRSTIDILVCTPGRLLDHLEYTAGFTLQHVRFLVLDEADRLLGNAYHNWVKDLVSSIDSLPTAAYDASGSDNNDDTARRNATLEKILLRKPTTPLQRLLFSATLTDNPAKLALLNVVDPLIVRCAAADGSGASGTAGAGGVEGKEDDVVGGYSLPQGLSEAMTVCTTARRPLVLATMLTEAFGKNAAAAAAAEDDNDSDDEEEGGERKQREGPVSDRPQVVRNHLVCSTAGDMAIIFTTSVDTTHRLSRLLQLYNGESLKDILAGKRPTGDTLADESKRKRLLFGGVVVEMSRNIKAEAREAMMLEAQAGKVAIIIATDNLARGIDLSALRLVINYDPPSLARTYVHRVGRTARAGRKGSGVTMLKSGQVGAFRKLRAQVNGANVSSGATHGDERLPKCKPAKKTEEEIEAKFGKALKSLASALGLQASSSVEIGE
jgi:ATP-dependent RNA helicase DDX51/DBP6